MKNKVLLLLAAALLASCGWPESSTSYTFNEKSGEVLLSDLYGLEFKPVCSVNGKEKKCGVVFNDFTMESMNTTFYMEYSATNIIIPGFKNASILSLQVKDENSGKVKPLLSYKQDDVPYMKGSAYVPSVMELHAANPSTEYTLSGYYEGDEWIKRDTTISIGDTLFANEYGLLKFTVQDRVGNKALLEMDLGGLLEKNSASTVKSTHGSTYSQKDGETVYYDYDYWTADPGSILFKPVEINFEPQKRNPTLTYYMNQADTVTMPFLHLVLSPFGSTSSTDSYLVNGGANQENLWIMVVDYAK